MANFNPAWEETVVNEGGYSDHPDDTGGKTMYGITEAVARAYGYQGEMKDLSENKARLIGKSGYWDRIHLGVIRSQELANRLFDIGFNAGVSKAGKIFQMAICLTIDAPALKIDGLIGTKTINQYKALDNDKSIFMWCVLLQLNHYRSIANNKESQRAFLRGWFNRGLKFVDKKLEDMFE